MSRLLASLLCILPLPCQAPAAPLAVEIPAGKSDFVLTIGATTLQVFAYRPAKWTGERMLMVMHGTLRNADEYRDHAIGMGDRFDALILAPKFDRERFPSRRYQRGGIQREDGTAALPEEWTYAFIPEIAARARAITARPDAQLFLIGHSAGGQFVVRMSAFQDTGAVRLVAANPGSAARMAASFWGLSRHRQPSRMAMYAAVTLSNVCSCDDFCGPSPAAATSGPPSSASPATICARIPRRADSFSARVKLSYASSSSSVA